MEHEKETNLEYYLPRNEYLEREGKIYSYVNKIDDKHDQNYNAMNLTLMTFIESQKPMNETMIGIREDLREVTSIIKDNEKRTDELERDVKGIEKEFTSYKEERNKQMGDILKLIGIIASSLLGGGGLITVLANIFLQ
ncbi:hypothetical protein [Mammaliicoccus sciuri]|uniref:hypothetical protein n=1 Tax=Mammaliicoccus sciuri TaxID=1296 RepID=UPI002DBC336A|nr:hypothetical protein [Mammaliicoccus sciuri]MEB6258242.1 hypothetical protein [Mammaliicoccus sciuri]MEB8190133.1 hypothetical protein [Mammaliicoccus sciuri]